MPISDDYADLSFTHLHGWLHRTPQFLMYVYKVKTCQRSICYYPKQSSDYKQQQSQLQQQQQRPAISFYRPSPSPQSFCGTNAGENDKFVTFDGLSGEKVNFTTTNLHNENGLLRTPNCSSITGHSSQWGFSNQTDFSFGLWSG